MLRIEMDRPTVVRQAIQAAAKGGPVSLIGVYGGVIDKFPIGAFFGKGLYDVGGAVRRAAVPPRLRRSVLDGEIDMTSIISHRLTLDEAPHGYEIFREKKDGCTKVVLRP